MNCMCSTNWIHPTDNMVTSTHKDRELKYHVYICENCKRYFIKRLYHFVELDSETKKTKEGGKIIKIPKGYIGKLKHESETA